MTPRNTVLTSVLLSIATCGALLLTTAAKQPTARFDQIDVGRINIREPDGTLRMVISNRKQFPGSPWRGGEQARPDRTQFAGMLFINDEGTENGGLIQKGTIGADGKASAGLSLTFDRFRQDQVIQLLHAEEGGRAQSSLAINDEADGTRFDLRQRVARMQEIGQLPESEREAAVEALRASGDLPRNRVRLGTTRDGGAALSLADPQGRPRMLLLVSAQGEPSILMLDEVGAVRRTLQMDTNEVK
jgi:hypothetical protein